MYSTFHGLETARRGMYTQQTALHVTGHNIANANTEGYSRQRANFSQTEPFPQAARNAPRVPGQMGTGVKAESLQRIRESYLDIQYRGENARASYWETRYDSLERIEDLMNEPSDDGISHTMNEFWEGLQDLSVNPEDSGARSVVRQRGIALTETFNYMSDTLQANKQDVKIEIGTANMQVNSMLRQINDLNKQIGRVEPHGQMPNDLYDERDRLLDQLSGMVQIEVVPNESRGQALASAEGTVNVFMTDEEGNRLTTLIDGEKQDYKQLHVTEETEGQHRYIADASFNWVVGKGSELDAELSSGNENGQIVFENSPGKLKALVESYGHLNDGGFMDGTYPGLLNDLNNMAKTFADAFNDIHENGWNLKEIKSGEKEDGTSFFSFDSSADEKGYASAFQISEEIRSDLDTIAAASLNEEGEAFAGDGSNALHLANVKDDNLSFEGSTTNVQSFYQGVIGQMAVSASEAGQNMRNTDNLRESVDNRRKEVSSVSIDEELSNIIQYQHAYNAAARNITMVDEMLDRIINNMGIVGR